MAEYFNGESLAALWGRFKETIAALNADKIGAVPNTRKINGKKLGADISLSASDIDAVALDGSGTMTGDLNIQTNGTPRVILVNKTNDTEVRLSNIDKAAVIQAKGLADATGFRQLRLLGANSTSAPAGSLGKVLQLYSTVSGEDKEYVLHTGNISEHGVAKIESGSYVGTGTNGVNHPTEITFGFVPKMVWVWKKTGSPFGFLNYGYVIPCDSLTGSYSKLYLIDTLGNVWFAKISGTTLSFYYGEEKIDEDTGEVWYPDAAEQLNTAPRGGTVSDDGVYFYLAIG